MAKSQDVFYLGRTPSTDRLIVIANDAEIAMPGCQRPDDPILGRIGILVFVDQHMIETARFVAADVWKSTKKLLDTQK